LAKHLLRKARFLKKGMDGISAEKPTEETDKTAKKKRRNPERRNQKQNRMIYSF
jgi:hypothetical protein